MKTNNKCIVYSILNIVNDKRYVGSTINPSSRLREHFNSLSKGSHHSILLQRAFNKYGEHSFTVDILEEDIPLNILRDREQYWIDKINPEYNIYKDVRKYSTFKFSDEVRNNIAKSHQREKYTVYCLNNNKTYQSASEAARDLGIKPARINNVLCGGSTNYRGLVFFKNGNPGWETVEQYLEYIKKDITQKLRAASKKKRLVAMLDKTGEIVKIFDSINDASRYLTNGISRSSSISSACSGKYKTALGYRWKYVE